MKIINASEVVTRLKELGHDYNPDKQAYKATIAGAYVELYDPNSLDREGAPAVVRVQATEADQYVAKGFLLSRPEPEAKPKAKRRTPPKGGGAEPIILGESTPDAWPGGEDE